MEKNERVIDKFIRERIVAGDFAEMKGRAEKLDLDQRFPSRIKSKLYFENFLPLLQDDLEKFLGIFNISLSTAFDGKNIVFIKVPQGVDYPVIYENGQPITVKSHTSENAVYFFLDKIKFERLERDSILLDGTHSDICFGQILAIISISLDTIVHEIGVAYGLPYEITPEGEIVNDLDKAYAQDYLELGDKLLTQFPRLRNLTKANLDKNLLTRDYAAGASSSNNGAEMCILRNQWKGQDIQVPLEVARKVFQEIVRLKSEDPNKWHALLTFTEFLYEKDLMSYTLHEETRFWRSSSLKKALDVLSGSIFINNNRTAPEYVCAIIRNSFESKPVTDELFSGTFNSPNSAYLMDPLKGGSEKDYQNSMLLRDPVTSPFDIFAQGFSLNIGAYTDQTNLPHLKEIGIGASLVGHSETRYREV
ncbi:MAG: triose-phosphate isomerase, partial [Candidatus Omnitrophica bacterium]|nr:triose-phosphate isomerase [Candidatus Omnitrophota bacterium]